MGLLNSSRAQRRSLAVVSVMTGVVLGAPLVALADWGQFQGSGSHDGISDGPSAPLGVAWTNEDIELESTDITGGLSSPVVAEDGTIVVVSPTAVLGFDAAEGSEVFSADRDLGPSSQPAIGDGADGQIVVYTEGSGGDGPAATGSASPLPSPAEQGSDVIDSRVNAVNLASGDPAWGSPVQLEDVVRTPVAVDETAAYVGDAGGRITVVELASGDVRWTVELGTPISGAVTLHAGRALVTTLGGREEPSEIVALDAEDGDELWRARAEDASNLVTTPVVADGRVLTLDAFGGVLAFDAEDGGFLWRTEVVNPLAPRQPFLLREAGAPAPVSSDGEVFAVDVTGRVYAFDAETGAGLWDHALNAVSQSSPPLLTDDHVLVPTDAGTLYAVDRRSGHLIWSVDPGRAFLRGLADAGDLLVGVTGAGDAGLVAFETDATGRLLDEPSPTAFAIGRMAAGFVLGGLLVGLAAVLVARPLQRRLGPALATGAEPSRVEDSG
ncbi:MAG: PQQ-binding-like beta-propeller repeat protein [Actinomycetota bacterium]|nr:PQQ-binding-like beta-propeller repeat protein [Actinomycetota bacterium]